MSSKENREYYLSRGRCPRCGGKNPLEPGKTLCRGCAVKVSEARRKQREWRRENHICTRCGKPMGEDERFKTCSECREYVSSFKPIYRRETQAQYNRHKLLGLCVKCGEFAEPGRTMCRKHLDEHIAYERKAGEMLREHKRERAAYRREHGLCLDCGRPTDEGHTRCPRCREMRMDSTRKYRIQKRMDKEAEDARRRTHENQG